MAVRLSVGDVVLVEPTKDNECIGMIKYVGPIVDHDLMSEYVGIELIDSIPNGHNGTIDGFTYFTTPKGYGFHTKITNVIQKLLTKHLFNALKKLHNLSQKHLKQIYKLEALLKTEKNIPWATPSKVDVRLPELSLNTRDNSAHSNYSFQSALTAYSPSSNATLNASFKNIHVQNNKMSVIPATNAVSDSDAYSTKSKTTKRKRKKARSRRHKIQSEKQHKNKTRPKKKAKLKKMRRSQSHEIEDNEYKVSRPKHRSKRLNLTRQRSKSTMENVLRSYAANQSIPQVQLQALSATSTMPMISPSKSAPNSPYNGPMDGTQLRYQSNANYIAYNNSNMPQYLEVVELSNVGLQQSNTQRCDEVYNHTQVTNMLVANRNKYAQYGHHYNDHSGTHSHGIHGSHASHPGQGSHGSHVHSLGFIQTAPTGNYSHAPVPSSHSAPSLSPYSVQFASYNEHYQRDGDMMQQHVQRGGIHGQVNSSGNKRYLMQPIAIGQEIVYQHK